jgi:hypothetical protein
MRPGLRFVAVTCVLAFTAADSTAFHFDIHVDVTKDALGGIAVDLPPYLRNMLRTERGVPIGGFSIAAIREIADANRAKDTGDCGDADNPDVRAVPCASLGFESLAALNYVTEEPPEEHFDAEKIQESSDLVRTARTRIQGYMLSGQFVAARKVLGGAFHAIQDFYAHTNYVNLGYRVIDGRLGGGPDSFERGIPRLAKENEPTCVEGARLLSDLNASERQALLTKYSDEVLLPVFVDRPLTSGYYFDPRMTFSLTKDVLDSVTKDIAEISELGKCRHGWGRTAQPGINKDDPGRPLFAEARRLAWLHSARFIVSLFDDPMADPRLRKEPAYILGLMGHPRGRVIEGFTVGVPHAPNDESWDTAVGSVLRFFVAGARGLKNIQPDVLVCMESDHLPATCAPVCDDADWSTEAKAYICSQPIGPGGVLNEPDLRVLVREVDFGEPRRVIASFRVEDAADCVPTCAIELESNRTVWIQFQFKMDPNYTPPYRPAPPAGFPAPETIPTATPGSSGGTFPSPAPLRVPAAGTETGRTAPVPAAGGGGSTRRPPTAAELGAALELRDADNCVGADTFFPEDRVLGPSPLGQQLGPDLASRSYQMAAFATAISDPGVKQAVLAAIQLRLGDDAFFGVMTQVIGNVQASRALVAAYQETAKDIVQRVVAQGSDRIQPSSGLALAVADVDRWILGELQTGDLVSRAIDLLFDGSRSVSAECALNELARDGFVGAVQGR